jgi:hypothetical protein
MLRSKTLRERIESRIARKRGEDVFLTREFPDLGIRFCVHYVLWCVENASFALATESMAAQLSRVFPAPQSFTARTDF